MKRKKVLSVILAAGMGVMQLTGCGKDAEKESYMYVSSTTLTDQTQSQTSGAASTAEPSAADETGGNLYVGEYFDGVSEEATLKIAEGENGKYKIEIGIYRLTTIDDGIGELTEEGLKFTATDAAGNPIGGIITLDGDQATVTFTDSTWGLLPNGESFLYSRTGNVSGVPKSEQTGTAGSNLPIKDNPEEAEYQIQVAMQYLFEEVYGSKIVDARIYVDKIYTAQEEQEEPLKSYNLGPDEVAFEVHYEILPKEGTDINELTVATGVYDEESGWIKEKYNIGILRPNEGGEPAYKITNFGTGF